MWRIFHINSPSEQLLVPTLFGVFVLVFLTHAKKNVVHEITEERYYNFGSQKNRQHSFINAIQRDNNVPYTTYGFLEVMDLSKLPREDVDYLRIKGCLQLPPKYLLDDFITAYFQYVHPLLPLLDEDEFWTTYTNEGEQGCAHLIPLFVFQAMLFASSVVRIYNLYSYVSRS